MIANPGLLRPPAIYTIAILIGVLLNMAWPLPFISRARGRPIGALVILSAVLLFAAATRELSAAGTPIPGNRPTTKIVRTGPYRISRNPIYLALSLLHLGLAFWLASWWLLATLVASFTLVAGVVVRREERYLEQRFGGPYLEYKASVRRWL